ncbi:MAG: hypothetical protein AMS18_13455 [Gemmatimonas sp. SG8_17]|nr:MAG: hypothetical protein AMS18_13455 [Gemmatimonas sp. SG8_17]
MSPQAAVAAVRQVIQQEIDDWNAGDLDAVLAIFADDVVRMLPDTVTVGKEALPLRWRQHLEENSDVWEPTIDEIEAAGNLVFVKLHFTETTTPKAGGESTVFHGEGVTVFRRSASGRWEVVLDQWFEREPSR